MMWFLNVLVVFWMLIFSRWASASEIQVVGNDTRLVFRGSWDLAPDTCGGSGYVATSTRGDAVSFLFKGTVLSVSLLKVLDGALVNIYLDGRLLSGNIDLVDPAVRYYQCEREVVNSTQLDNTDHNVTVQHAGKSTTSVASNSDWLALIDIVFTTPDLPSSSSTAQSTTALSSPTSSSPDAGSVSPLPTYPANSSPASGSGVKSSTAIGEIVGGILGGVLLGMVFAWFLLRKRYRKNRAAAQTPPTLLEPYQPNIQQQHSTLYYGPPPVSHLYTEQGSPWNPYHSNDTSPTEMPSSSDRPTSMVSAPRAHQGRSQPEPTLSRTDGDPPSRMKGSAGWIPSAAPVGMGSDTSCGIASPPPPQYDFQEAGQKQ